MRIFSTCTFVAVGPSKYMFLTANNEGKIEWAAMMIVANQCSGMMNPAQTEALDLKNLGKSRLDSQPSLQFLRYPLPPVEEWTCPQGFSCNSSMQVHR